MILSSASPQSRMVSTYSVCSKLKPLARNRAAMPSTPLRGVRISWLMVARNADFARAPASAASLAATSSVMSVKDCTIPPDGSGSIRNCNTVPLGRRLTYDFGNVPLPVKK